MRRIIAGTLALTVLSSTWLLGAEGAAKPKAKAKAKKPAAPPVTAQLQQMKDQLNQQQQQINQLQQQLQSSNQQLQSAQQQLQSGVQSASQQAAAAQQAASSAQQAANSLNSSVADIKTSTATMSAALATTQKDVKELLSPVAVRYKGVSITPIGFFEGSAFWRNRAVNQDSTSPYDAIPLNGTARAGMNEFRFSSRNSQVGFVVSGDAGKTNLLAGFQMDFNGGNFVNQKFTTSNNWAPRLRWAWGQATMGNGWFILGGQHQTNSNLFTKATNPLTVRGPVGDDNESYTGVGTFRAPQIRIGKSLMGGKYGIVFAVEQADYPSYANDNSKGNLNTIGGLPVSTSFTSAGVPTANPTYPSLVGCTTYTNGTTVTACGNNIPNGIVTAIPVAPDLWVRLTTDQKWGHLEVKGVARFFRDRLLNSTSSTLQSSGTNQTTTGGGFGLGGVIPVTKKADFVFNTLAGAGIGRYLSTYGNNTPDVTLSGTGSNKLVPIKALGGWGGIEWHPVPKFDVNVYYGLEYYQRYNNNIAYAGNGFANITDAPGTQDKAIQTGMATLVYRLYRGPYGTFQTMLSTQYTQRTTWVGIGNATYAGDKNTAKGDLFVGIFSVRYILP